MRLIPVHLNPSGDFAEIIAGGDLHIGHRCHDKRRADAHRDYILASPDRYAIDLGDPIENNLKESPGSGIFEQVIPPREQKLAAKTYYQDIAKEGKLLGMCESNHAERSVKTADFSPTEYLCEVLHTQFIKYQAIFAITVGNSARGATYLIHVRHFAGGAATPEGVLRQLRLKSQKVHGCDVHLSAHCHMWTHGVQPHFECDARHSKIRRVETHYVTIGAFVLYDSSYAEGKDYDLPAFGMASLKLYRDTHRVEVQRLLYS